MPPGETCEFHDIGPDHYYLQDGHLFLAFSGPSSGVGVIGQVLVNVDTGEIVELKAGKTSEVPWPLLVGLSPQGRKD